MNTTKQLGTVLLAFGLCAWATGQHRSNPNAVDQLKLLQANQELMNNLLADSLRLSRAETTLARASECQQAAKSLAKAIEKSATQPERLSELGDHFTKLVKEGLAPTLAEAREQISPGSREFPRLKELQDQARQSLTELEKALPANSPLKQKLVDLSQQLTTP